MNLRQERLLSRRSQLGRERFKCWNAWCSWHRQRHERGRYRCVALSLFTDPAVHHVRVQAMRQGHTTDAGPRLGTQGKYLCLELLAVFTPAWAVLIQRLFHRLHDPPSWGRCPLHAGSSRWDRRALTDKAPSVLETPKLRHTGHRPHRLPCNALRFPGSSTACQQLAPRSPAVPRLDGWSAGQTAIRIATYFALVVG